MSQIFKLGPYILFVQQFVNNIHILILNKYNQIIFEAEVEFF